MSGMRGRGGLNGALVGEHGIFHAAALFLHCSKALVDARALATVGGFVCETRQHRHEIVERVLVEEPARDLDLLRLIGATDISLARDR